MSLAYASYKSLAGHRFGQHLFALLSGRDESWLCRKTESVGFFEWRDAQRDALDIHSMGDDLGDQLLLELREIYKLNADAGVLESVNGLAVQRQTILVRELYFETEFVARVDVLLPVRETPTDTDLLQKRILPLTIFRDEDRGNIKRESYVFALIN